MVSEQLQQKGYEQFLPMYMSRRLWTDRVKVLQLPLFAGYMFCRFDIEKRLAILRTPGVVNIVGKGPVPVAVDPRQVEAVRLAVTSGQSVKPWTGLQAGQKVRVELGPLRGVVGTLLRYKNEAQLILQVDLMQRAMSVEVDETWVAPCEQSAPVVQEAQCEMAGA
jgi:transcription antitermination factor NusG